MKKRSLKKNAILNILRTLMIVVFPLVTFPYSSRVLLPDGVGKVSFARTFIEYFIIIATLGIFSYGSREAARVRDDKARLSKVVKEIFTINMISTCFAYILLFITIFAVPDLKEYKSLLILISSKILFIALGMEWLYSAVEDFGYITMRAFIFQIVSVILLFVFVREKDDYLIYASIAVFSNVGSNVCNWIHSRKYVDFSLVERLELKKHFKAIIILFATASVIKIYNVLDITMLGFICGDWQVGLYTAASKISHIIISLVVAVSAVLMPRLSYYAGKRDMDNFKKLLIKNIDIFLMIAVPCTVGLSLVGKGAIYAFSGREFMEAVPVMRILNPIIIIIGLSHVAGGGALVSIGREKYTLVSSSFGAACNVIMNLILIPKLGVVGAAVGTLITELIVMMTNLHFIQQELGKIKIFSIAWIYCVNSVIMAVMVIVAMKIVDNIWGSTFLGVSVGILVYGILLLWEKNEFVMDFLMAVKRKLSRR